MGRNFTQLHLHGVWATWDRLPLITPEIQPKVYNAIANKCSQLGCKLKAIGGIADHVHILTSIPTTISIADLMKHIKGNSAHFITHEIRRGEFFKWQGSYGAFTVSNDALENIIYYINNQAIHHQKKSLIPMLEITEDCDF